MLTWLKRILTKFSHYHVHRHVWSNWYFASSMVVGRTDIVQYRYCDYCDKIQIAINGKVKDTI